MEYRSLGDTGVSVSSVGLGCEALGGTDWGHVDVDDAMDAVRVAWDSGVTVFDTADAYGLGESERRLSRALGRARHDAVIVSKFGVRWQSGTGRAETWRDSSPEYLEIALEASLRRLDVDQIPIYLVHWPDDHTPLEDTFDALERYRLAGKVGMYGVSNFWGLALSDATGLGVSAAELPLNLLDRRAESALIDCHRAGIGVLAYGAYAQGLLCGAYGRDFQFSREDRRHRLAQFEGAAWESNARQLDAIRAVATVRGVALPQVALQWVLRHRSVSCALVGVRNRIQLSDVLAVEGWKLSEDECLRLSNVDSQAEQSRSFEYK